MPKSNQSQCRKWAWSASAAPRRSSIPSGSSRNCAPRATPSRPITTAPMSSSSIPAGFLDSAKAKSLSAIGEAMKENGRVIVTGCMGAEAKQITDAYPGVLAVTGPQQYEAVVNAVHAAVPPLHDRQIRSGPAAGLAPHAAPLRLFEDFRRLQQPLHLLHHSELARRSRQPPGRRSAL